MDSIFRLHSSPQQTRSRQRRAATHRTYMIPSKGGQRVSHRQPLSTPRSPYWRARRPARPHLYRRSGMVRARARTRTHAYTLCSCGSSGWHGPLRGDRRKQAPCPLVGACSHAHSSTHRPPAPHTRTFTWCTLALMRALPHVWRRRATLRALCCRLLSLNLSSRSACLMPALDAPPCALRDYTTARRRARPAAPNRSARRHFSPCLLL